MSRRVVTAPRAAEGLRAARKWLLQDGSGAGARRRWQDLRAAQQALRDAPCRWPPSAGLPGYRKLSVSGHQIIYRVSPDTGDNATAGDVTIVAVFGPGQEVTGVD